MLVTVCNLLVVSRTLNATSLGQSTFCVNYVKNLYSFLSQLTIILLGCVHSDSVSTVLRWRVTKKN